MAYEFDPEIAPLVAAMPQFEANGVAEAPRSRPTSRRSR